MRTIEVTGRGTDNIRLVDRPEPEPGPGKVQVRIRAATLNYRDLLILEGRAPYPVRTPYVPLSCGVGIVTRVGEGVTRAQAGDRVLPTFFQPSVSSESGDFGKALGGPLDGVAREIACFAEGGIVKIPDSLSDLEAATLPCAALTAWAALFGVRSTQPGEVVLLLGTGGVSIAGLQLAKAAGATAIVTSSSDAKLARARALGADYVINYRRTLDWGERARAFTEGRGVDVVLEVGGAGTLPQSLAALRPGGDVASIGLLSGTFASEVDEERAVLQRIHVGTRDQLEALVRGLEATRVRPVVDRVYPLEQLSRAMQALREGAMVGKIGIQIV
jgi:NADPH:quinone reductase-like Zn-dependent oxidoreductase